MPQIDKRGQRYRARYYDPLGRRHSKTFVRKADAERFLRELRVEMDRGHWLDPKGAELTVAEWSEEFLQLARRLSPTTQATYRRDLERYVLPRFAAYRIGRLPADEIENWLMDEVAAGIAPSSVHRHYRTFRRMLEVAVEKEKLVTNPCHRVKPPRSPAREMVFLTWEQSVELAEAHAPRYRALLYLAIDAGMRWGELIGLRRAKVDLRTRKVRVTEQLIRMGAGDWLRKKPKTTNSVRSITVSAFTATVLAEHLERYAQPGPDGLVFTNTAGNPLISSSFHTHAFGPTLHRAGPGWPAAFMTFATRALPVSPRGRTRSPSSTAWATRQSTSPWTATATPSPSSTRRSPSLSASALSRPTSGGRATWCTRRSGGDDPPPLRRLRDGAVALLRGLGGDAELGTDALPGDPGAPGGEDRFAGLALALGPRQGSTAQQVLGYGDLVLGRRLVLLETLCELVGVVEDVLHRSGHRHHLRNFGRASMAWTMSSNPSAVAKPTSSIRPVRSAPMSMVSSSNSNTRIGWR